MAKQIRKKSSLIALVYLQMAARELEYFPPHEKPNSLRLQTLGPERLVDSHLQGRRNQSVCSMLTPIKLAWERGRQGDNTRSLQYLLRHPWSSWRRSSSGGASL